MTTCKTKKVKPDDVYLDDTHKLHVQKESGEPDDIV